MRSLHGIASIEPRWQIMRSNERKWFSANNRVVLGIKCNKLINLEIMLQLTLVSTI